MPLNFFLNNFKIKISFLILAGFFLFSSSVSAAMIIPGPPPSDNTPPQISDISIEPNKVKVNQTITIKAKVVGEENNNVSFVGVFFPELDPYFILLFDDGSSGNIYTNTWTVPEDIPLGEYQVAIVALGEYGGETTDYSGKFEVVSSSDFFPEKYAPNLWFDSDENYYPIDPFFYANDIDEISGEASQNNYIALPDEDKKKNKFTVFYHIAETEDKTQWVYEYFFYYAYNDFRNEHYHDWEGVFVFVDKETEKVERVVASAHGNWTNNNEYFNPNFNSGERVGIMIEGGSHANCTDRNNDGLYSALTLNSTK